MRTIGRIKIRGIIEWSKLVLPIKKAALMINGVEFGKNLMIRGKLKVYNQGEIKLGNNVTINSADWANPVGGWTHTYFQVGGGGTLLIGYGVGISNSAITCWEHVEIGNNVLIGSGVRIYDTDFHPLESRYRYGEEKDGSKMMNKPVYIEDGAFIGAGSIILKGVRIGKNSIVGAGSVVAKSIPEGEIWVGNPAKKVRESQ